MRKMFALAAICAALALAFTGCSKSGDSAKPAETSSAPAAAPVAPAAAPAALPEAGMVTETMDGDSMTYARLDLGGGKSAWVMAPQAAVNVGEVVTIKAPIAKQNYRSNDLKRDFELIYSVSAIAPMSQAQPHPKTPVPNVEVKNVAKMSGGYTVAELYGKRDQLAGKEVTLRAKVVKFTGGIMGTNWMHLRDGTGDDKTNDLTITSNNQAKAGDTVVVKGILKKDVDIGSGYFFPLIIQDAAVKPE